jgi:nucleoside-diphosphate-sugar epimerase
MRIAVTGASGGIGTHVLRHLTADPAVEGVVALSRGMPAGPLPRGVSWHRVDLADPACMPALVTAFRGCDTVVHLAWAWQPSHDGDLLRATNVDGTWRVLHALRRAGVPGFVHASSAGVYSPGPKDRRVDETWPAGGVRASSYSAQKLEAERLVDTFERLEPRVRVARLRPAVVVGGATDQTRYVLGPFLPRGFDPRRLPAVPALADLVVQLVHADDAGRAFALAATTDVRGSFNVAGEPAVNAHLIAEALGVRAVRVPTWLARSLVDVTWRLRVQPVDRGWLEMALAVPLLDTGRARADLAWTPVHDARSALVEALGTGPLTLPRPVAARTGQEREGRVPRRHAA